MADSDADADAEITGLTLPFWFDQGEDAPYILFAVEGKDTSFRSERRAERRRPRHERRRAASEERLRIERERRQQSAERRRLWLESDEGKAATKEHDEMMAAYLRPIEITHFQHEYARYSPFQVVSD